MLATLERARHPASSLSRLSRRGRNRCERSESRRGLRLARWRLRRGSECRKSLHTPGSSCVQGRGRGRENIFEQINNTTGTVLYLHHDQAGSTRLLTGSTGKTEGSYSYNPYGTPEHTGTATTPLGYDAQYTNSDTGLIYLRNRVYDPATAQFLTVDPAESISGAPYNYAGDNPLNREDAVGLLWTPVAGGAAGADAVCGATVEIPGVDIGTCGAAGISTGIAAAGAAIGVVTAVAGNEGGDEGEAELKKKEAERENCGNPATPPGSKFKWEGNGPEGSEEGSWFDPETREYLRPDFKPSSHGPHYDYRGEDGTEYRIYPDGRIEPK
jgi:RHS repeat-associated protein